MTEQLQPETADKLTSEITKLNEYTRKSIALHWVFLRGLVAGVGTAIGATIITGILLATLSSILQNGREIPLIDSLVVRINEAIASNPTK